MPPLLTQKLFLIDKHLQMTIFFLECLTGGRMYSEESAAYQAERKWTQSDIEQRITSV